MRDHVLLYVNGRRHRVRGPAALRPLAEWLRRDLGLTGTKIVCNEGDCGACTTLAGRPDGRGRLIYSGVDACLLAVAQLDACHVVTVEGLCPGGRADPVQRAFVDRHASQCGYCTPGLVMAVAGLAEAGTPADDDDALRRGLTGNVCRCTGYLPVLDAARDACASGRRPASELYLSTEMAAELASAAAEPLHVEAGGAAFYAPTALADALAYKANHHGAVVAAGCTELGVWRNKRGEEPGHWLSLARVPGLAGVAVTDNEAAFGANATWADVEAFAADRLPEYLPVARRFASPQIRRVATLAGNVANGSPIADSLGLLAACEGRVELAGVRGRRAVPVDRFYRGYKVKDLAPDELIVAVVLPLPGPGERLRVYKVSKRVDMDIAAFGAGVRVRLAGSTIDRAWVAYTGVAPTVVRLPRTEAFLAGRPFAAATFAEAGRVARSEVEPITDVRGSRDFRLQLAENILRKFYHDAADAPHALNGTA